MSEFRDMDDYDKRKADAARTDLAGLEKEKKEQRESLRKRSTASVGRNKLSVPTILFIIMLIIVFTWLLISAIQNSSRYRSWVDEEDKKVDKMIQESEAAREANVRAGHPGWEKDKVEEERARADVEREDRRRRRIAAQPLYEQKCLQGDNDACIEAKRGLEAGW